MKAVSRWSGAFVLAVGLLAVPALWAQEKDEKDKEKDTKGVAAPATLIVKCEADAKLLVDDTPTLKTGPERTFLTPDLEPGVRYYYIVSAMWEPNNYTKITRTRKVYVYAGKTSEVDLTKADPKKPDKIFIRYVPTPTKVVEAMLKLGKVGKGDVVYDLGCGDGRIVVTAVSKFGAKKGVGVDLDPERIKDSKETAKEAMVEDKVEFRQIDVMKVADLNQATVVCLYLGNELNKQLRPILEKQLKPGSRIVSHRFVLGDWKPEKTETITDDAGITYDIHLWTVKGAVKEIKDKEDKDKKDKEDKARKEKEDKDKKDKEDKARKEKEAKDKKDKEDKAKKDKEDKDKKDKEDKAKKDKEDKDKKDKEDKARKEKEDKDKKEKEAKDKKDKEDKDKKDKEDKDKKDKEDKARKEKEAKDKKDKEDKAKKDKEDKDKKDKEDKAKKEKEAKDKKDKEDKDKKDKEDKDQKDPDQE